MINQLRRYLQHIGVDSFQKLNFLLFLSQNPDLNGTVQEYAKWLYFGDEVLLEKIILDLQMAGLVDHHKDNYRLCCDPSTKLYLQSLVKIFDDPLARQELLQVVQHNNH